MVAAGVAGYFLEARQVPLAPLILGLILGPMVEENLRAGLIKTSGDFTPFVTRPICLTMLLVLLAAFVGPWIGRKFLSQTKAIPRTDNRV
jgi:TctA family transporter